MSVGYQYEDCHCHPWCSDPARDEAVRASEDGRSGPLPTLEECIERVTERRPVPPGGGGNVTGLRTERVTLEVKHFDDNDGDSVYRWNWSEMMAEQGLGINESVRVVEEAHFDDLAQVAMERDAAIRERDTLRADRITQALTADRFASAVAEADRIRARVAELEAAPAASVVPSAIAMMIDIITSDSVCVDQDEKHAAMATLVEAVCPGYVLAPAASGAAGTEAVAWGVKTHDGRFVCAASKSFMESEAEQQRGTLHPLYAAPQAAPGWLTAEEREAVQWLAEFAATQFGLPWPCGIGASFSVVAHRLLARETPPEVVLPRDIGGESYDSFVAGWNNHRDEALKALAAAGVTVKEVGA